MLLKLNIFKNNIECPRLDPTLLHSTYSNLSQPRFCIPRYLVTNFFLNEFSIQSHHNFKFNKATYFFPWFSIIHWLQATSLNWFPGEVKCNSNQSRTFINHCQTCQFQWNWDRKGFQEMNSRWTTDTQLFIHQVWLQVTSLKWFPCEWSQMQSKLVWNIF